MDILVRGDDAYVERSGGVKGGMVYVDQAVIAKAIDAADTPPTIVPGGSACNTTIGIAQLGGKSRFVGKCGSGPMGRAFRDDLVRQHVAPLLLMSKTFTGRVLSIITPDAQRSMLTDLGASAELSPDDIGAEWFEDAAIVHIEGYLLFNDALITGILKAARDAGACISLDLASYTVVESARATLPELVTRYVDILIANEDEAAAFTGIDDEPAALARMAETVDIAVVKLGARGSLVARGETRVRIAPYGDGTAIDTTGAGDLWASGFLFGLVNGCSLEACGALASRCGHAVCQEIGTNIPDDVWSTLRNQAEALWQKNG